MVMRRERGCLYQGGEDHYGSCQTEEDPEAEAYAAAYLKKFYEGLFNDPNRGKIIAAEKEAERREMQLSGQRQEAERRRTIREIREKFKRKTQLETALETDYENTEKLKGHATLFRDNLARLRLSEGLTPQAMFLTTEKVLPFKTGRKPETPQVNEVAKILKKIKVPYVLLIGRERNGKVGYVGFLTENNKIIFVTNTQGRAVYVVHGLEAKQWEEVAFKKPSELRPLKEHGILDVIGRYSNHQRWEEELTTCLQKENPENSAMLVPAVLSRERGEQASEDSMTKEDMRKAWGCNENTLDEALEIALQQIASEQGVDPTSLIEYPQGARTGHYKKVVVELLQTHFLPETTLERPTAEYKSAENIIEEIQTFIQISPNTVRREIKRMLKEMPDAIAHNPHWLKSFRSTAGTNETKGSSIFYHQELAAVIIDTFIAERYIPESYKSSLELAQNIYENLPETAKEIMDIRSLELNVVQVASQHEQGPAHFIVRKIPSGHRHFHPFYHPDLQSIIEKEISTCFEGDVRLVDHVAADFHINTRIFLRAARKLISSRGLDPDNLKAITLIIQKGGSRKAWLITQELTEAITPYLRPDPEKYINEEELASILQIDKSTLKYRLKKTIRERKSDIKTRLADCYHQENYWPREEALELLGYTAN